MHGRTDSRPRTLLLLAVLFVFGTACAVRLGYWQLARHDWLVAQARDQVTMRTEIAADRGTIYDRSGTVTLATTIRRDRLVAFPALLADKTAEAATRRATIAATWPGSSAFAATPPPSCAGRSIRARPRPTSSSPAISRPASRAPSGPRWNRAS